MNETNERERLPLIGSIRVLADLSETGHIRACHKIFDEYNRFRLSDVSTDELHRLYRELTAYVRDALEASVNRD